MAFLMPVNERAVAEAGGAETADDEAANTKKAHTPSHTRAHTHAYIHTCTLSHYAHTTLTHTNTRSCTHTARQTDGLWSLRTSRARLPPPLRTSRRALCVPLPRAAASPSRPAAWQQLGESTPTPMRHLTLRSTSISYPSSAPVCTEQSFAAGNQ